MAEDAQGRTIMVQAMRTDGRVALWERHPAHPGGEVFIAPGAPPVQAAPTPAVLRALADGRLRELLLPVEEVYIPQACIPEAPVEAAPVAGVVDAEDLIPAGRRRLAKRREE